MFRSLRALRVAVPALIILTVSSACDAPPGLDTASDAEATAARRLVAEGFGATGRDLRIEEMQSVQIAGSGSFRPGEPIMIQATVDGRLPSARTKVDIMVLDLALDQNPSGLRHAASWQGAVAVGAHREQQLPIVFSRPGYYRVVASARGEPEETREPRHGLVAAITFATLWILVDESGGRITDGYDASVANGRTLMFGSYGPFVSAAPPMPARSGRRGGPSAEEESVPSTILEGYVKYYDPSLSAYAGVQGRISGTCYGRSENAITYDLFTNVIVYVMESGYYMAECPDGYEFFYGVFSLNGSYSDVYGKNGSTAGTTVEGYLGGSAQVAYVNNDAAASAFNKAEHYIPIANSRFGQSRSKIAYWVSNDAADSTGTYRWQFCFGGACPDGGRIYGNPQGAFGELGYFSVIHEYGHAFHRVALGAAYSSAACDSLHYINAESTLQCAYREGFADFFAVWIAGDQLTGTPTGVITDYRIEGNQYLSTGQNGAITEGAVAAFLYDLVDTSSDPNSVNNQSGSSDDSIGYPGSYISDIIMNCSLAKSGGGTVTILDGIDQFVYCAERSLDDQSLVNSATGNPYFAVRTQAYTSVSGPSNTPTGWSVSNIRAAWKYDLFKHGSLP